MHREGHPRTRRHPHGPLSSRKAERAEGAFDEDVSTRFAAVILATLGLMEATNCATVRYSHASPPPPPPLGACCLARSTK